MTISVISILAECRGNIVGPDGVLNIVEGDVVHFDATGCISDKGDTFLQISHLMDAGYDDGSYSYPVDLPAQQRMRREHFGLGLWAKRYDTPGSYLFRHKCADSDVVESAISSITVNVIEKEVFYAGNMYALSLGTDFTGAPAGAIQVGNVPSWKNIHGDNNGFRDNSLYFLNTSDDWSTLETESFQPGLLSVRRTTNVQLRTFGSGSANLGGVSIGWPNLETRNTLCSVFNVEADFLQQLGSSYGISFAQSVARGGAYIGASTALYLGQPANTLISYSDCDIQNNRDGQPSTMFINGHKPIVIGTNLGTPDQNTTGNNEHVIRAFLSCKGVYQNTAFDVPGFDGASRTHLRIQSDDINPSEIGPLQNDDTPVVDYVTLVDDSPSEYNSVERVSLLSANGLQSTISIWLAPEEQTFAQVIRDSGVFQSFFNNFGPSDTEVALGGKRVGFGSSNTFNRAPQILQPFKIYTDPSSSPLNATIDYLAYNNQVQPALSSFAPIETDSLIPKNINQVTVVGGRIMGSGD